VNLLLLFRRRAELRVRGALSPPGLGGAAHGDAAAALRHRQQAALLVLAGAPADAATHRAVLRCYRDSYGQSPISMAKSALLPHNVELETFS